MASEKLLWAYLSTIITLTGYGIYLFQTFNKSDPTKARVRPQPLTWMLFGFLTGTGWLVQVAQGGKDGSWCLGITSAACFLIAGVSLYEFTWKFTKSDWRFVIWAGILFLFSVGTRKIPSLATLSAILATGADLASYGPMFTKCWKDPNSDSATSLTFNSVKCIPALLALQNYTVGTTIYLIMLTIVNGGFAVLLVVRRKRLSKKF